LKRAIAVYSEAFFISDAQVLHYVPADILNKDCSNFNCNVKKNDRTGLLDLDNLKYLSQTQYRYVKALYDFLNEPSNDNAIEFARVLNEFGHLFAEEIKKRKITSYTNLHWLYIYVRETLNEHANHLRLLEIHELQELADELKAPIFEYSENRMEIVIDTWRVNHTPNTDTIYDEIIDLFAQTLKPLENVSESFEEMDKSFEEII
jgi:hypothetical protein